MGRGRPRARGNIPAWFKLERYAYAKDLSAKEWLTLVYSILDLNSMSQQDMERIVNNAYQTGLNGGVRKNPDVPLHVEFFEKCFSIRPRDWHVTDVEKSLNHLISHYQNCPEELFYNGVWAMSNFTLVGMYLTLISNTKGVRLEEWARKDREAMRSGRRDQTLLPETREFLRQPFFKEMIREWEARADNWRSERMPVIRPIVIDLSVPDSQLMQSFSELLAEMRRTDPYGKQPKGVKDVDFSKWHEYQLIPYSLLMKWQDITGVSITNAEMVQALFPHEFREPDYIRKTVAEQSRKFASVDTFYALISQAAKEVGEKSPR